MPHTHGTQNTNPPKVQLPPYRRQPWLVPTASICPRHRQVGAVARHRRGSEATGHHFPDRAEKPRPRKHLAADHQIGGGYRPARLPAHPPARRRSEPLLSLHHGRSRVLMDRRTGRRTSAPLTNRLRRPRENDLHDKLILGAHFAEDT